MKVKKKELKNTLFKMEKTLEDIINEIKTSFLYDRERVFKADDRKLIYKVAKKLDNN